jgi:hypothetical protein
VIRETGLVLVVILAATVYFTFAPPIVEGTADVVLQSNNIGSVNGESTIETTIEFVLLWMPLFTIIGTIIFVHFRAFRKEAVPRRGV